MKRIIIGVIIAAAAWTSANAKGGVKTTPIPPAYDYARESKPGYVKDYCEDSVGNHIYCTLRAGNPDGAYAATYRGH